MSRKSQFSVEQQKEIVSLYKSGVSIPKIAEMYQSKASTIASLVKKKIGMLRSNKQNSRVYKYDESYFEKIDCPDKAYWLGFIYADGCVQDRKDGTKMFGLTLSSLDIGHLEKLKSCLNATHPIKTFSPCENSYSNNPYSRFQIHGEKIFNDLVSHGVTPNKTLKIDKPQIDRCLDKDFIRGYLDGDGCITSHTRATGNEDYAVKIVGTKKLLNYIKDFVERENVAKINKFYKRRETDEVMNIEVSGNNQVKKLLDILYKDSNIYLERKYEKYNELCEFLHSRAS